MVPSFLGCKDHLCVCVIPAGVSLLNLTDLTRERQKTKKIQIANGNSGVSAPPGLATSVDCDREFGFHIFFAI